MNESQIKWKENRCKEKLFVINFSSGARESLLKFNYVRRQITLHQPAIRKLIVLHSIVNNFSVHFRPRLSSSKSLRYKRMKLRWEFVGLIVLMRMSLKLKVAVLI